MVLKKYSHGGKPANRGGCKVLWSKFSHIVLITLDSFEDTRKANQEVQKACKKEWLKSGVITTLSQAPITIGDNLPQRSHFCDHIVDAVILPPKAKHKLTWCCVSQSLTWTMQTYLTRQAASAIQCSSTSTTCRDQTTVSCPRNVCNVYNSSYPQFVSMRRLHSHTLMRTQTQWILPQPWRSR